ncbi:hypothetical protein ACO22_07754, partial [Paracoccidioides brasiliensis]
NGQQSKSKNNVNLNLKPNNAAQVAHQQSPAAAAANGASFYLTTKHPPTSPPPVHSLPFENRPLLFNYAPRVFGFRMVPTTCVSPVISPS